MEEYENPFTNCGDKKTNKFKTANLNILFKIKSYWFSQSFTLDLGSFVVLLNLNKTFVLNSV